MNERQSIIGFTEAELGFFLAILCMMLLSANISVARQTKPKPTPPTKAVVMVPADSANRLAARMARLQRIVDSLNSPIWPSCQSRGIAKGPILSLIALHGNRYRLGADSVNIEAIAAVTAESRKQATSAKCRQVVQLSYLADLSAAEYERARQALFSIRLTPTAALAVER
jgi:hypothetical protein